MHTSTPTLVCPQCGAPAEAGSLFCRKCRATLRPTDALVAQEVPSPPTAVAKKHVLWKWSIAATLVVVAVLFWRCGSGLLEGRRLSADGVQQFHSLLNAGQYERIYDSASDQFRASGNKEDLIKFLQAIHRKLGDAGSHTLNGMNVTATPTGTYISAVYRTTFTNGEAVETFIWVRHGGGVVLNGYNIQSMKLVVE